MNRHGFITVFGYVVIAAAVAICTALGVKIHKRGGGYGVHGPTNSIERIVR